MAEERLASWEARLLEAQLEQWERALALRERSVAVLEEAMDAAEDEGLELKERVSLAAKVLTQATRVLRQEDGLGGGDGDGVAGGEGGSRRVAEADRERMARLRDRAVARAGAADGG